MKLAEAIRGFLLMRATELSPTTIEMYRWALERMCTYLGDPEVKQIADVDLQHFFIYMQTEYVPRRANGKTDPLTPRSIENIWTAMRSFFNWAAPELELSTRPDKNIRRPKYHPREIVPFTEAEVKALLKAAERTMTAASELRQPHFRRRTTGHRDVAMLLVLLDTGLRVSEFARLQIQDVNMETGEVFVKPFGTGLKTKSRIVMIGKAARKAVWRYLADRTDLREDDPLFATIAGHELDRNSIRLLLADMGERTGVRDVHPHRFRHTFAIQFLRNGGDVFTLQRYLGHSSLEMVQHYLSLAQSDLETAHRQASPVDRWRL